ncbi:MAG: dihydrodipicolinate synthase family protein [Holophagales bacterium]|nr:dihydrodipicolinate synthase family protein [Holophagales bacterium]
MSEMSWKGVIPAITTPFDEQGNIDHAFLAHHCSWLVEHGCRGIVAFGSLGEGATLELEEKLAVLETCVSAVGERVPVVPGVAALSTAQAVRLARAARDVGCKGLMVLPPYVHKGPFHEMRAHFEAIFEATQLSCMLYNNPGAYGVDVLPEAIAELAQQHGNLHAVKESSGDVRRITAIRALVGDRLALFAGLDDVIVEAIAAGAVGWIAGLVNALPRESVELFDLASAGEGDAVAELYRWFLPLLRLDTVPEFVQLIKLVQQEVGMGCEAVRPPRRVLQGAAREAALETIRASLASRPALARAV